MKSRRTGGNAKKRATVRGQGMAALVVRTKRALMIGLSATAAAGLLFLLFHALSPVFRSYTVELSGNEHLTDEEMKHISGLKSENNLFGLSARAVHEKLKESPWIQSASVRKEYPSKLLIKIKETEPFALLDMKGKMFIVDDRGKMLEELKDNTVPFLPVISSDPYNEKESFREAVNLAMAIKNTGMLHKNERIEIIAHQPNEIAANIDGRYVKIGSGEHEEKLMRLIDIEEEIKKRNIPVAYVDLRFAKKAVVKPVNEVIR